MKSSVFGMFLGTTFIFGLVEIHNRHVLSVHYAFFDSAPIKGPGEGAKNG